MRFANPYYLALLVLLPLIYLWERKRKKVPTVYFPNTRLLRDFPSTFRLKLRKVFYFTNYLIIAVIICAFARPQSGNSKQEVVSHGIDIVLIVDTSPSMSFQDFYPKNRMQVAKEMAKDFIMGRKFDRMGIVIFGSVALTQAPLSLDHNSLTHYLSGVSIGMTKTEGTAIGMGLGMGIRRLQESEGKTKVAILLTDGRNNTGEIDPITAARLAKSSDIKVYTIGIGSPEVPKEELDEATLTEIAQITSGLYFRADSPQALSKIFKKIDEMEKSEIKIRNYINYSDLYHYLLIPGVFLFCLQLILENTYLRRYP